MRASADTLQHTAPTPRPKKVAQPWKKNTAQVLAELPDSATPWQQDSAVQAYFKPGQDIHYSEQPDTLGLPGQRVDAIRVPAKVWKDLSAFHKWLTADTTADSVPSKHVSSIGVMADPLPYHPGSDPLIGSILIGAFLLMVLLMSHSRTFLSKQLHTFFYTAKARTTEVAEQPIEIWYQGLMGLVTLVLCAIAIYCGLIHELQAQHFTQPHVILGMSLCMVGVWFAVRALLYSIVNWAFFTRKKNLQWFRAVLLLSSAFGIALLPVLLLYIFGHLSWRASYIYIAVVYILIEFLFIYKSFVTFFKRAGDFLQIILYFCALEMLPLAGLAGLCMLYHDNLIINF